MQQRILIIRLSAIGDVAMASGLASGLRRAYPRAFLGWLVEPAAAELLRDNPYLDEVLIWPKPLWRRLWRQRRYRQLFGEIRRFRARLRACRFELALDTQGILKSALLARLSGAPRRLGVRSREGSRWLMSEVIAADGDDPRLGSEYAAALRRLTDAGGATPAADDYRMALPVDAAARRRLRALLPVRHGDSRYVALCPFTTRPQKHWFEERWAQLAERLRDAGLTPLLLGGPADREAAARIAAAAPGAGVVDLTGRTGLADAVAAIDECALLIGVDTGLTHIGIALERPTVALFGSTRPYLHAHVGAPLRVLYAALPCSPCRRHPTCAGRYDCMRRHEPAAVAATALSLLSSRPARGRAGASVR